jgi:hypothetical protein
MINRYLLTKGRIQDVGMQTHRVALSDHLATNALFALPREFLSHRWELCAKWASPGLMEARSDVANRIFGPKTQAGTPLLERSDHL